MESRGPYTMSGTPPVIYKLLTDGPKTLQNSLFSPRDRGSVTLTHDPPHPKPPLYS